MSTLEEERGNCEEERVITIIMILRQINYCVCFVYIHTYTIYNWLVLLGRTSFIYVWLLAIPSPRVATMNIFWITFMIESIVTFTEVEKKIKDIRFTAHI